MKTIIDMAEKAGGFGFVHDAGDAPHHWQFTPKELKRFAALVRADEREACAKVCENEWWSWAEKEAGLMYAATIRARGNT